MNSRAGTSDSTLRRSGPSHYGTGAQVAGLAVIALLIAAAAAVGNLSAVSTADKYEALEQPAWAPPSWLFGPVWTLLYSLMAIAAWLVWRAEPWQRVRVALGVFVVQLILNALWTPLFFAAEWRGVAFAEILVLLAAIVATIVLFARHQRWAAGVLVPYLLWTVFAAALNLAVWQLNT
ncbi:tryptophan-rich sensory protein [Nocardia otitidiscaviarum]|uniref:TspO/MBR family protein n=1 Tax=Nocardia otitidiscaviarum TaxID=1823 RepID=UPI000693CD2B|nr:TspO/MBR family protein [Nocardia otitidiscaviarum]MBF6136708.1 tryptophan-rich sensory protein [Nocardia otitidiscaviarum]MBF6484911.1 tryptophan-rich sensory protein [Nocardia otitidiscaviarum]